MSVVALDGPDDPDVPLLLDSPHSGDDYPPDFAPPIPWERIRRAEDFAVDQLFADAPAQGVPLFKALFPRIYVDVNRALSDLDPRSVDGELSFRLAPSAKAALGKGLVWMDCPPPPEPTPLYGGPLPAAEVERRIARYWRPYRDGLAAHLSRIRERHGIVYYLDCHSMQSVSTAMHEEGAGQRRPQIVISDRDGRTCAPAFTAAVKSALEGEDFTVAVNDPYKGADLVATHGAPQDGRHALQIEIRRDFYMDEATTTKSPTFDETRERLGRAIGTLVAELSAEGTFTKEMT